MISCILFFWFYQWSISNRISNNWSTLSRTGYWLVLKSQDCAGAIEYEWQLGIAVWSLLLSYHCFRDKLINLMARSLYYVSSKLESFLKSGLECILPPLIIEAFVEYTGDLPKRIPNRKIFIHSYIPWSYFMSIIIKVYGKASTNPFSHQSSCSRHRCRLP